MKKLLLIAILFASTMFAIGQNVGYLSFAPADNGLGLRIDNDNLYVSMSYGNYYLPCGAYIKDHAKIAMGVIYKHYTLGLSYHHNGAIKEIMPFTKQTLKPISIEVGARVFVYKRFVAALRYDVLRQEGIVDFGFLFPRL